MKVDSDTEGGGKKFNEDILCEEHGELSTDASCMRLVPATVWDRLHSYFPDAPSYDWSADVCQQCQVLDAEDEEKQLLQRITAHEQRVALGELYHDRQRPQWKTGVNTLNVVSSEFLLLWRKFVRDPVTYYQVTHLNNKILLCEHGGFMCNIEAIPYDKSIGAAYVWPAEWKILSELFACDVEIQVFRVEEDDGNVTMIINPDICDKCRESRIFESQRCQLDYTDADIHVRRVTDSDKSIAPKTVKTAGAMSTALPMPTTDSQDSDPEFIQDNGKRKKLFNSGVAEKVTRVEDPSSSSTRRSSRHRRARGEKTIKVSSTNKLIDLKIKIMNIFSVAPYDQHLLFDGNELTDSDASLASLGITPGVIIYLEVDEPSDDQTFIEDKAAQHEKGFTGTGLSGSKTIHPPPT